jgi:hypothetical protein
MSGEEKPKVSSSEESFMNFIKGEARIDEQESKQAHAERIIHEVHQDIDAGITREEAISFLAKLDIAIEASRKPATIAQARELKAYIRENYIHKAD